MLSGGAREKERKSANSCRQQNTTDRQNVKLSEAQSFLGLFTLPEKNKKKTKCAVLMFLLIVLCVGVSSTRLPFALSSGKTLRGGKKNFINVV